MNYKISTMLIIVIVCFLSGCTKGTNEVSINNKPKSETIEKSNDGNSAKTEGNESNTLDLNKFNILIQDEKYNIVQQINGNREETIILKASEASDYIIRAIGDEASKGEVIITFK